MIIRRKEQIEILVEQRRRIKIQMFKGGYLRERTSRKKDKVKRNVCGE